MAIYRIADIDFSYETKYPLLKSRSEKYLAPSHTDAERLEIPLEMFQNRKMAFPSLSDETIEYMCMGSQFSKALLLHNGMMLHASAIELGGEAYLFSAPSGVGKSTHASLWMEYFKGRNPRIINDDKPAIRKKNGIFFAYGTPFSGKTDLNQNISAPVKAVVFLERGEKNTLTRLSAEKVLKPLFEQTIRPSEEKYIVSLCAAADELIKKIPFYRLDCTAGLNAVKICYEGIANEKAQH